MSGGEDGEVEWEEEEGSGWGRCFFGGRNTGDAVRAVEGKRRRLGNERRSGTASPAAEGAPPRLAAVGSSSLSSPARNSAATAVALTVIHLHDTSLTLWPSEADELPPPLPFETDGARVRRPRRPSAA